MPAFSWQVVPVVHYVKKLQNHNFNKRLNSIIVAAMQESYVCSEAMAKINSSILVNFEK